MPRVGRVDPSFEFGLREPLLSELMNNCGALICVVLEYSIELCEVVCAFY